MNHRELQLQIITQTILRLEYKSWSINFYERWLEGYTWIPLNYPDFYCCRNLKQMRNAYCSFTFSVYASALRIGFYESSEHLRMIWTLLFLENMNSWKIVLGMMQDYGALKDASCWEALWAKPHPLLVWQLLDLWQAKIHHFNFLWHLDSSLARKWKSADSGIL